MKCYCVVYTVYGIYYRYRCYVLNKREARKLCMEMMGCSKKDIVEVYEENI